jgi:hypothetical protein
MPLLPKQPQPPLQKNTQKMPAVQLHPTLQRPIQKGDPEMTDPELQATFKTFTYEERKENFAKVRALIMKILTVQPGLTQERLKTTFYEQNSFQITTERLQELIDAQWVTSRIGGDNNLHYYPVEVPP